jgi:hypothetical protein
MDSRFAFATEEELLRQLGGSDKGLIRRQLLESARAVLRHRPPVAAPRAGRAASAALSEGEQDALRSVGFDLSARPRRKTGPLARSIVGYMALVGSSLTTAQTAELLNVNASRIRQRIEAGSLYAIEHDGEWRLPLFQVDRESRLTIPGLARVLKALPPDLHPLGVAAWFTNPHPDLRADDARDSLSPREWLTSGLPVETVVRLAAGFTR